VKGYLAEHLVLRDPGPYRRTLMRMATFRRRGRLPPKERRLVRAYDNTPARLVLPRGMLATVRRLGPLELADRRLMLPEVDFGWTGQLYSYQLPACRELARHEGGVLVAPPGSGKTVMGLAMIAHWRQPALWLVHTLELQRQAYERARQLFSLPASAYGLIGEGVTPGEIGQKALYIAMVQSLSQIGGWIEHLAPRVGTLVIDEAHHSPATTYQRVVGRFPARYRLGLSATPNRSDGLGPLMRAMLGTQVRIPVRLLVEAGRIVLPEIRIVPTRFQALPGAAWDQIERAPGGASWCS